MMEVKQVSFFDNQENEPNTVECLGMTFNSEDERREYFRSELRKKLPELKEIEGYPIGEDEDIIALSDPPYYTACPNPWINEMVNYWESNKSLDEKKRRIGPYSSDVSEGKNNTIYNAHSYLTKVPHKAIMRYVLHYTDPGDIIFDGFCGSGMTGLACEFCEDENEINELGYIIKDGFIFDDKGTYISKIGKRNAILQDLSPAATFIAYNYNKKAYPIATKEYLEKKLTLLKERDGWMYVTPFTESFDKEYSTEIKDIRTKEDLLNFIQIYSSELTTVEYYIWSESYSCNSCGNEMVYWDAIVNDDEQSVKQSLHCPYCGAISKKKDLSVVMVSEFDYVTQKIEKTPKQTLIKINYKNRFGGRNSKGPGLLDEKILEIIQQDSTMHLVEMKKLPKGYNTSQPMRIGINYVHQFYTHRTLLIMQSYLSEITEKNKYYSDVQFLLGSVLPKMTKMNRYMPQYASKEKGFRALVGPMSNALYFPPISVENNFISQIQFQLGKIVNAWNEYDGNCISTQSSTNMKLREESIDYIFIDPPFGANIMYSEMNFSRETWLKILTNNKEEAIENNYQDKNLDNYGALMTEAFKNCYKILKSGKWITVEFSNTKSSVWNKLQSAIQSAGFVVARVDALDKQRGGFHAMTSTTAVKQDLVISAYKPDKNFIKDISEDKTNSNNVWLFINQHLEKLPVFEGDKDKVSIIAERTVRVLFDRMVAFYVQAGLQVPISSSVFQEKIRQKYVMRDGMVFLDDQVAEYDKKRILAKDFAQQSLFISDEGSAIEWLRQQLLKKPQSRQDLHPQFMKEIQHIAKHEELPELDNLLAENFLNYTDDGTVPDQIANYLRKNYHDMRGLDNDDEKLKAKAKNRWYVPDPSKQADLEKLREKSLLREFNHYVEEVIGTKKKLKVFRTEAIRTGFKKAWSERNYHEIIEVAERLPEKVIQEDDKLLMYYDNASIRLEM